MRGTSATLFLSFPQNPTNGFLAYEALHRIGSRAELETLLQQRDAAGEPGLRRGEVLEDNPAAAAYFDVRERG
jgi:hypothetical protein